MVFWLLISLSREYPSMMTIPVEYKNIPGKKVVVNDLPKVITVEIRTSGFRIISNHFTKSFDPISVDVGGKMERSVITGGILAIPTNSFITDFSNQLGKEINITGFRPDSIIFNFKDKETRFVPVRLSFQGSFQKQYDTTSAPLIDPSVIEVSGPPAELAKLTYINTELLTGYALKADLKAKVKLIRNKLLTYNKEEVSVVIPVQKFTEGSFDIDIHAMNVPKGFTLKTYPGSVKVRYSVPLSEYNKISPPQFDVVADASTLEEEHPDKLTLQLMTRPSSVRNFFLDPEKVDYILRKQ